MIKQEYFSSDIEELLHLLHKNKVKYLIVGGEAVIYYGHARLTGDIDIFYERTDQNTKKLYLALNEFWSDDIPGVRSSEELMKENMIFQFGVPPNRLDLINVIENVTFKEAWGNKKKVYLNFNKKKFNIYYIGLEQLIKNKKAVGRHKDKEDLEFLTKKVKKS